MTRLLRLLGVSLLVLAGCEGNGERDIIVADSTLVVVLADLHLADARARIPDVAKGALRDSVLRHYGLDEETFQLAMDGFVDHPDELINLYNQVLDRLNEARTP